MFRNKYFKLKDYLLTQRLKRDTSILEPGYILPDGRQLIVSLTSFEPRLALIDLTLSSLLSQSLKPSKIILWLSHDIGELPDNIKRYEQAGITVERCKDIGSYKKLVPCLKAYPDDVIVTADDDLLYPKNWLKDLVKAYLREPGFIHCHRAHCITFDDNRLKPYKDWIWLAAGVKGADSRLFPTGGGGALYPPDSFHDDVINEELFLRLSPKADDVWFRVMALLKGTIPSKLHKNFREFPEVQASQENPKLAPYNVGSGGNDKQLKACLDYYNIPTSEFLRNKGIK